MIFEKTEERARLGEFFELDRAREWKTRGGVYGDGQLLMTYRWLVSFYIFGFHIMFGRNAHRSPYPHTRLRCWLVTGHRKEVNNPEDPARRWYCRGCGTVWPEKETP